MSDIDRCERCGKHIYPSWRAAWRGAFGMMRASAPTGALRMSSIQNRVGRWGEGTFPNSTPTSIYLHLRDEAVLELGPAITAYEDAEPHERPGKLYANIREEAADVYLLLLHLAHRYDFDLQDAAEEKFAEVVTRTYGTDSGRGYVRHDESEATA